MLVWAFRGGAVKAARGAIYMFMTVRETIAPTAPYGSATASGEVRVIGNRLVILIPVSVAP